VRYCASCGARLARDQCGTLCSPCRHRPGQAQPTQHGAEFWQRDSLRDALAAQHFGRFLAAYRAAHQPPLTQAAIGSWLGMSQAQVSRLERANSGPADLRKLRHWAAVLQIPADLLWFTPSHALEKSATTAETVSLDDVHRRDMLKLTGAVAAGAGILSNAPWQRLAEALAGQRAADAATVSMIENRTAEFFRSEEALPARQLVTLLRDHYDGLRTLLTTTGDGSLRRRLYACLGQTEALAGWTLFDLQRHREAVRLYRNALASAREAGDNPLAACVLGYWSYLISTQGDVPAAARTLEEASGQVRGAVPTTQAWLSARRAEELAALGEHDAALRALDQAVDTFDYPSSGVERPWTSFFTPTRLGGLAVSAYGRMDHPNTDEAADTLLNSMAPTENKVKAIVLADLATSAARGRDYDRVQSLAPRSARLAVRTECSLAIDRLWELAETLPETGKGTAGQIKHQLVEQLMGHAGRA
jgi:transcriptional regulator with XRE-family HTH domain